MSPLHIDTLVALRAAREFGLPLAVMLTDLRRGRHPQLTAPQLERALRDLADSRFAAMEALDLGAKWRITARGESALTEAGL